MKHELTGSKNSIQTEYRSNARMTQNLMKTLKFTNTTDSQQPTKRLQKLRVGMPLSSTKWQNSYSSRYALTSTIQAPRSTAMPRQRISNRRNENDDPDDDNHAEDKPYLTTAASSMDDHCKVVTPKRRRIIDDDDSKWEQPVQSNPAATIAVPSDTEDPNFAVLLLPAGTKRQCATQRAQRRCQNQSSDVRSCRSQSAPQPPIPVVRRQFLIKIPKCNTQHIDPY